MDFISAVDSNLIHLTSTRLFVASALLGACSVWCLLGAHRILQIAPGLIEHDEAIADEVTDELQAVADDTSSVASFFSYGESETLSLVAGLPRTSIASLEGAIDAFKFGPGEFASGTAFLEEGYAHLKAKGVAARTRRSAKFGEGADDEYKAKVYCLRIAFDRLFIRKPVRKWFQTNGQLLLARVLQKMHKDVHDFNKAYDDMCRYVAKPSVNIGAELAHRGVVAGGFFDVALDFVLMDAFDDLAAPPPAVAAVLGNRWLPKQVILKTIYGGVYAMVKTKSAASSPGTFSYYFYELCATVTPTLACGFLGPDPDLKRVCENLHDVVMSYLRSIFTHDGDRYASAERLEKELFLLARRHMGDSESLLEGQMPRTAVAAS